MASGALARQFLDGRRGQVKIVRFQELEFPLHASFGGMPRGAEANLALLRRVAIHGHLGRRIGVGTSQSGLALQPRLAEEIPVPVFSSLETSLAAVREAIV